MMALQSQDIYSPEVQRVLRAVAAAAGREPEIRQQAEALAEAFGTQIAGNGNFAVLIALAVLFEDMLNRSMKND